MSSRSLFETLLLLLWAEFIAEERLLEPLVSYVLTVRKSTRIFDAAICIEFCLEEPSDESEGRFGDKKRDGLGREIVGFIVEETGAIST